MEVVEVILSSTAWGILALVKIVLAPVQKMQAPFEGEAYVTGSLVIGLVKYIRDHLVETVELCSSACNEAGLCDIVRGARIAMGVSAAALPKDINARWEDRTEHHIP